jgi:hypothetical protein
MGAKTATCAQELGVRIDVTPENVTAIVDGLREHGLPRVR